MNQLLLQITTTMDSTAATEGTSTRLINLIFDLGIIGIVVMALIFVLSCIAIYILVERYRAIKKASNVDDRFMDKIKDYVMTGNIPAAEHLCMQEDTPVARMVAKGLRRIGRSYRDINAAIENVGNLEIQKLEKGLSRLATIAGAAPMLGFFGTVTGMISSFYALSQYGNDIDKLAKGIYEAMLTTAFGLLVGIIAYIGYNILVSMVSKVIYKMEASTMEFIDLLQEPAK